MDQSTFQNTTISLVSVAVGLAGIVLAFSFGISSTQGDILKDVGKIEANLVNIERRMAETRDGLAALTERVATVQTAVTTSQVDARRLLVASGLVSNSDVFETAVINGSVYLFPDPELAERLKATGTEFEQLTPALSGIRVMRASAIQDGSFIRGYTRQ